MFGGTAAPPPHLKFTTDFLHSAQALRSSLFRQSEEEYPLCRNEQRANTGGSYAGKVLTSFIGRPEWAARDAGASLGSSVFEPGQPGCEGETSYQTAIYDFVPDNVLTYTTPLFGAALLEALAKLRRKSSSADKPWHGTVHFGTRSQMPLSRRRRRARSRGICLKDGRSTSGRKSGKRGPRLAQGLGAVFEAGLFGVNCFG